MANVKISNLPAASALDGTEKLPLVQGSSTKRAALSDVWAFNVPIAQTQGGTPLSPTAKSVLWRFTTANNYTATKDFACVFLAQTFGGQVGTGMQLGYNPGPDVAGEPAATLVILADAQDTPGGALEIEFNINYPDGFQLLPFQVIAPRDNTHKATMSITHGATADSYFSINGLGPGGAQGYANFSGGATAPLCDFLGHHRVRTGDGLTTLFDIPNGGNAAVALLNAMGLQIQMPSANLPANAFAVKTFGNAQLAVITNTGQAVFGGTAYTGSAMLCLTTTTATDNAMVEHNYNSSNAGGTNKAWRIGPSQSYSGEYCLFTWFNEPFIKVHPTSGRLITVVPNAAPTDANIAINRASWYLDESGNNLKARVRYSDGTYKTATIAVA